jgi:hypothetical protein
VPARFLATRPVSAHVLVVDDSWGTGAQTQAAATALKAAGAKSVAIRTIGRWFTLDYPPNLAWLRENRKVGWTWNTCCLHGLAADRYRKGRPAGR